MRALDGREGPKRPPPLPVRGASGGWRDVWDGPDCALLARAAVLEAEERLEREARRRRDEGQDKAED